MENKTLSYLHNTTLKRRFIAIIVSFFAFVLLMLIIYQNIMFSKVEQNMNETATLVENSLLMELDGEFSDMAIVSSTLSGSVYVQEFLAEKDAETYYEKAAAVSEIIRKTTYPHINTDSIITITTDGSIFRFTGGISNTAISTLHNEIKRGAISSYSVTELDGTDYFCLVNPVFTNDSKPSAPVGYMVTLSNVGKVQRTLLELNTITGIDSAVIFNDIILLSSNEALTGQDASQLDERYGSVTIMPVTGSDLYAATAITKEALNYTERLFFTMSLIILPTFFIAIFALYRLLSAKMVSPMLEKSDNMQMVMLKTQIDAHFIVNTIDCIESLLEQDNTGKAAAATHNLAGMLRTLHEADEEVNIYEQLESLNYYIEIMNIRHNDKYNIGIDVDDRLVEYTMPTHILQPLVENALTHGMGNKPNDCQLSINGRIEGSDIVFEVSDNGQGMLPEAILKLQDTLNTAAELEYAEHSLKGIALANIHRRIRTRYGKKYGLTIAGALGKGVTVIVRLPIIDDL